mgnify:FL=1|tara:strand:- start:383 stop:679 length:297 start_codon:yes stop_codon:yes gene_type:complete
MKKLKLKNLLGEHVLGELPSEKLMKMKWNPVTDERPITEGLKSNIMQKWDKEETIMTDLRQFILSAKDAGGSDLLRGIADALKVMSNYAMGEYKKSKK